MKCVLVNRHDLRSQMGIQGNQLLDYILGADVRLVADGVDQNAVKQRAMEELRAQGEKPYLIGPRAAELGVAAYAGCMLEMVEQLEEMGAAAALYPPHFCVCVFFLVCVYCVRCSFRIA